MVMWEWGRANKKICRLLRSTAWSRSIANGGGLEGSSRSQSM
jgi:hypothetical protein